MSIPYKVVRQYFVPQHGLSRLAGFLANITYPPIKNYLISYFLKRHSVNLAEAENEDPFSYASFNAFFTRKLKKAARPIAPGPKDLIAPADSTIYQFGHIKSDTLLHAKKHHYTLSNLLGRKDDLSNAFQNGQYYCFYLAPHDYHRVHMPADGRLIKMRYIPGRLFSVNQLTAEHIDNMFARNERVVAFFEGSQGRFAVILVGAMLVGGIHTRWAGKVNGSPRQVKELDYESSQITLQKGDELGFFSMGSTAIVLFENKTTINSLLEKDQSISMGELIGEWV